MNRFTIPVSLLVPAGVSLLVLGGLGCSWDRFEQLRTDAPVETLYPPSDRSSTFGTSVVAARFEDTAMVLVSGPPHSGPGTVFSVGIEERPTTDPFDKDVCVTSPAAKACSVAERPAALARARSPNSGAHELCFVAGVGYSRGDSGLWTRCADRTEFVYPMPDGLAKPFIDSLAAGGRPPVLQLVADRSASPILLAGAPEQGRAWFYDALATEPIELAASGTPGAEFGRSLAVLRGDDSSILVVGSGGAAEVWFFRATATGVESLGCLSGAAEFGRALAAGDVDGDGLEDLAVSDATRVDVFLGSALTALQAQGDAVCSPELVAAAATMTCKTNKETSDCSSSRFGMALAIADLQGDGKSEVVVGAPRMTVRGVEAAGAVLVYDAGGQLVDTRIVSSPLVDARFGSSLAAVSQGKSGDTDARDVLAVGAPGDQQTSLVYCATVAGSGVSSRCE